jgi:general secretion pathway protein G
MRKDHLLAPVNADFDLYSMGKDGQSMVPFTAKASRDDIVRANNGGYVGLVSDY